MYSHIRLIPFSLFLLFSFVAGYPHSLGAADDDHGSMHTSHSPTKPAAGKTILLHETVTSPASSSAGPVTELAVSPQYDAPEHTVQRLIEQGLIISSQPPPEKAFKKRKKKYRPQILFHLASEGNTKAMLTLAKHFHGIEARALSREDREQANEAKGKKLDWIHMAGLMVNLGVEALEEDWLSGIEDDYNEGVTIYETFQDPMVGDKLGGVLFCNIDEMRRNEADRQQLETVFRGESSWIKFGFDVLHAKGRLTHDLAFATLQGISLLATDPFIRYIKATPRTIEFLLTLATSLEPHKHDPVIYRFFHSISKSLKVSIRGHFSLNILDLLETYFMKLDSEVAIPSVVHLYSIGLPHINRDDDRLGRIYSNLSQQINHSQGIEPDSLSGALNVLITIFETYPEQFNMTVEKLEWFIRHLSSLPVHSKMMRRAITIFAKGYFTYEAVSCSDPDETADKLIAMYEPSGMGVSWASFTVTRLGTVMVTGQDVETVLQSLPRSILRLFFRLNQYCMDFYQENDSIPPQLELNILDTLARTFDSFMMSTTTMPSAEWEDLADHICLVGNRIFDKRQKLESQGDEVSRKLLKQFDLFIPCYALFILNTDRHEIAVELLQQSNLKSENFYWFGKVLAKNGLTIQAVNAYLYSGLAEALYELTILLRSIPVPFNVGLDNHPITSGWDIVRLTLRIYNDCLFRNSDPSIEEEDGDSDDDLNDEPAASSARIHETTEREPSSADDNEYALSLEERRKLKALKKALKKRAAQNIHDQQSRHPPVGMGSLTAEREEPDVPWQLLDRHGNPYEEKETLVEMLRTLERNPTDPTPLRRWSPEIYKGYKKHGGVRSLRINQIDRLVYMVRRADHTIFILGDEGHPESRNVKGYPLLPRIKECLRYFNSFD